MKNVPEYPSVTPELLQQRLRDYEDMQKLSESDIALGLDTPEQELELARRIEEHKKNLTGGISLDEFKAQAKTWKRECALRRRKQEHKNRLKGR